MKVLHRDVREDKREIVENVKKKKKRKNKKERTRY